jgi:group I intron endonuclease
MQLYQLLFPNGKKYIGITSKTAEERFKTHCVSHKKYPVALAVKKYGKENIVLTVLATVDSWELLCLAEIEAIEKINTKAPNGYNLTNGGDGIIGLAVTEERKEKMRIAMTGKKASIESRIKMSIAQKNRPPRTDITREKLREVSKNNRISRETREKMRLSTIGVKHTKERRANQSNAALSMSKEVRDKISLANSLDKKGKKMSPETIAKRTATYAKNRAKKILDMPRQMSIF